MKKLKIIFAVVITFSLCLCAYIYLDNKGILMTKEERFFYGKLAEFKDSGREEILLKEMTDFEWDEICFIAPYEAIDSKIIDLKKFTLDKEFLNSNEESQSILVFLNLKLKTGKIITINRNKNLIKHDHSSCYPKESSFFKKENKKILLTKF